MSLVLNSTDTIAEFVQNEKNISAMMGYVGKKVGNPTVAEDIVQTVLERMIEHWENIRHQPNPTAYVYQMLSNAILDFWRQDKRKPAQFYPEWVEFPDEFNTEAYVLFKLSYEEIIQEARNDTERLLVRRIYAGYTSREIAEQLGRPVATVESWLKRFRDRLRNRRL